MFTGIIEEVGTVLAMEKRDTCAKIFVAADLVLDGTKIGDSIAVNGTCLTVTERNAKSFAADVTAETLKSSALSALKKNSPVNLERAMPANGRFGGHIVSGHIDGTGRVVSKKKEGNAVLVTVEPQKSLLKYMVKKGSVAVDGISLTIADLSERDFCVSVIPHTGQNTTLTGARAGDLVNIETDVIGKYVERLLHFSKEPEQAEEITGKGSNITAEFLLQNGF